MMIIIKFLNIFVFFASIYALSLVLINFNFGEKIEENFNLDENIYLWAEFIGRFINFSNVDYSLIFIILRFHIFLMKNF